MGLVCCQGGPPDRTSPDFSGFHRTRPDSSGLHRTSSDSGGPLPESDGLLSEMWVLNPIQTGAMKRLDLRRLAAMQTEFPSTVIAQVRLAFPEIEAALERGHRLKDVHAALKEAGIEVGY